jgi:hypothetical protein
VSAWDLARRVWRPVVGIAIGAGAGAAYAHFVGCATGGCPLTSNPVVAAAVGGLLGYSISGGPSRTGGKKA